MRKNLLKLFFILLITFFQAQKVNSDTLHEKTTDIEAIVINDKDYEKIEYSYGLKQEINSGLKIGGPPSSYEIGLKFRNTKKEKGKISNIDLFLYKTERSYQLVDLEINIYKLDSLTEKPGEKLNKSQIIYTPKNRKKANVKVNVEKYNIPFPKEGVLVAVKWLYDDKKFRDVGPSVRLTTYEEMLTRTRYDENIGWSSGFNLSRKQGKYTNVMIGLEVYVKKRKKSNE